MAQNERLQQKIKELQDHFDLLSQKIPELRKAHGIGTDPTKKFQLKQQIEDAEKERAKIEGNLELLETIKPTKSVLSLNPYKITVVLCLPILLILGYIYYQNTLAQKRDIQHKLTATERQVKIYHEKVKKLEKAISQSEIGQNTEKRSNATTVIDIKEGQNIIQNEQIDLTKADIDSALVEASANGNTEMVRLLLKLGANINAQPKGYTPLIMAATYGHTDVVKILIANKANPLLRNFTGDTALMRAAQGKKMEIVDLLSEYQASIKQKMPIEKDQ
ncbi:MAG: ankyrin repeat domain-containing protein [Deltaproteobacteria bacterium]|nr:ankyrin repeat domain-containing protein [Deltaproteobacteria bacterium]